MSGTKPYRTVLVTGASSGLGHALAKRAARDCEVLVVTARREEALRDLAESLGDQCRVVVVPLDLAEGERATRVLTESLRPLPPCDLAVLNAGMSKHLKPGDPHYAVASATFQINLLGMVAALDAVLPGMKTRDKGHIVGISSVAGYRGLPGAAAYCASKAAMHNYLESLRCDCASSGIVISTIHPGFVRTAITAKNTFPMPFLMDLDPAADLMWRAVRRRKVHFAFPWQYRWLFRFLRLLPDSWYYRIFKRVKR